MPPEGIVDTILTIVASTPPDPRKSKVSMSLQRNQPEAIIVVPADLDVVQSPPQEAALPFYPPPPPSAAGVPAREHHEEKHRCEQNIR